MYIYGDCETDTGVSRAVNQDAIFFRCLQQKDFCFALGIVCDGIGGLANGEIASSIAIGVIAEWYQNIISWIDIKTIDLKILYSHFLDAVESCNQSVRSVMKEKNIRIGTTLSAIMFIRDRYYIVQVGDSRVYRYQSTLQQLTADATFSKMHNGVMKGYLLNYIGKSEEICASYTEGHLSDGDIFVYGSDGAFHCLDECDIRSLKDKMQRQTDYKALCENLITKVIERGERDNISIGIIRVTSNKNT